MHLVMTRSSNSILEPIDHAVWVPAPVRNCALGRDDSEEESRNGHREERMTRQICAREHEHAIHLNLLG